MLCLLASHIFLLRFTDKFRVIVLQTLALFRRSFIESGYAWMSRVGIDKLEWLIPMQTFSCMWNQSLDHLGNPWSVLESLLEL